jgi:hypothetical protein
MNVRNLVRMKPGDLVRFRPPYYISSADGVNSTNIRGAPWHMGLLIECEKISTQMCTIFYGNQTLRIPVRDVQRMGRRYLGEGRRRNSKKTRVEKS